MLTVLLFLCVSTQAIHTSKIVKRELLQHLQVSPASGPSFQYLPTPVAQPPTAYQYKESYDTAGSQFVSVQKIQSPVLLGAILNKDVAPAYSNQNTRPSTSNYDNGNINFHPDFSISNKLAEPWNYNQFKTPIHQKSYHHDYFPSRDLDKFSSQGKPDFNYETTGGFTGPQTEPYLRPHSAMVEPFGHYDHRLKQGYSPVHYRYNDDVPAGQTAIECNRYHCPL